MRMLGILALCVGLGVVCSCGVKSIHHVDQIGDNATVVAVDAKQRFLVSTVATTSKDNNAATSLRRVCLEPSPDVFSAISLALEGSAKYKDEASADVKMALSEAAATIGVRTETIQLLRDAMYRVCELGLNGGLEAQKAFELHQRYQKSMVTLAAVSALADATRPTQVAISGRATVTRGALMAELTKQIEEQNKVKKDKDTAKTKATESLSETAKSVCETKVTADSCADSASKCKDAEGDGGTELCAVKIGEEKADSDEGRLKRAKAYCAGAAHKDKDECKKLGEQKEAVDDAGKEAGLVAEALKQLETDLEEVKKNSDLSAITEVVRLAPTTVQPDRANIKLVADIVGDLVTQVYADEHLEYCLDVMKRREELAEQEIALAGQSVKPLATILSSGSPELMQFGIAGGGTPESMPEIMNGLPSDLGTPLNRQEVAQSLAALSANSKKEKALKEAGDKLEMFEKICAKLADSIARSSGPE